MKKETKQEIQNTILFALGIVLLSLCVFLIVYLLG